jgi:hypothetical protein
VGSFAHRRPSKSSKGSGAGAGQKQSTMTPETAGAKAFREVIAEV